MMFCFFLGILVETSNASGHGMDLAEVESLAFMVGNFLWKGSLFALILPPILTLGAGLMAGDDTTESSLHEEE
jgi:hypothetical protein